MKSSINKNSDNDVLQKNIETVDLHLERIQQLLQLLKPLFPFTDQKMTDLDVTQESYCDALIYRFMHVQDTISTKIFTSFLGVLEEAPDEFTFIDRLNFLEKIGIIKDAYQWRTIRKLRNHFSHDYVDKPELQAEFLNDLRDAIPVLVSCLENIKNRLSKTLL